MLRLVWFHRMWPTFVHVCYVLESNVYSLVDWCRVLYLSVVKFAVSVLHISCMLADFFFLICLIYFWERCVQIPCYDYRFVFFFLYFFQCWLYIIWNYVGEICHLELLYLPGELKHSDITKWPSIHLIRIFAISTTLTLIKLYQLSFGQYLACISF